MKKIYTHLNGFIYEYQVVFDKDVFNNNLNYLYQLQLEKCFFNDQNSNISIEKRKKINTSIINTTDLINYLINCFDNDIIELSELKNLINSTNSPMRTPQTMIAISNILGNIDFKLLNKKPLIEYNNAFKAACRKGFINSKETDIVTISLINEKVFDNLFFKPCYIENYVKTITM